MAESDPSFADKTALIRRELRALRELPRLARYGIDLARAPRGEQSVMVLPGYSTNDLVMAPLRRFLASRGHRVRGWGLGTNRGNVAGVLPAVIAQIERQVGENGGRPIALVGWSMGGVFAREAARARKELVEQVITLATPTHGGRHAEDRIDVRNADPIERPITAFYSTIDGVVSWRGAIDDLNPNVTMIEVNSSHLGITLDPTVWLKISHQLR